MEMDIRNLNETDSVDKMEDAKITKKEDENETEKLHVQKEGNKEIAENDTDTIEVAQPTNEHEEEVIVAILPKTKRSVRFEFTSILLRGGLTTVFYPSSMCQVLQQIGYEPYYPRPSTSLLGRPVLVLPAGYTYMKYIYCVDGFFGLYRGLVARLVENTVYICVSDFLKYKLKQGRLPLGEGEEAFLEDVAEMVIEEDDEEDDQVSTNGSTDASSPSSAQDITVVSHFKDVGKDWICRMVGITVSFPLHVVAVRAIAEFVGRDGSYYHHGFFRSIYDIFQYHGISGFFAGLVPKLVGETIYTFGMGISGYFVRSSIETEEFRGLMNFSMSVLMSAVIYPFNVVSNTMLVSGSRLAIGQPPFMPKYENWIDCWKQLQLLNILNRGSSGILRYYTGPTVTVNGVKEPICVTFGPNHLH